jgi:hypothetical protein
MNIWLPHKGDTNVAAWKVDSMVNQYDERLMFGRNEDTGDWCVFIKMPSPAVPYPILGFGNTIPEPSEALDRLVKSDTMRHGDTIYKDVMRSQKKFKDDLEYNSNQASEDSVERIEHLMRKKGDSPIVKVFMNNTEGVVSSDS